jgi:ketosteroid isomerase-like protein
MLRFGNEWGRRTLVYARDGEGEWRLLHMHASNLVAAPSRLPFALG